ncbi:MAG TPA: acyl-CoA reductase [Longimicrobiales bacterium]
MKSLDIFHLPATVVRGVTEWRYLERPGVRMRFPVLMSAHIDDICRAIRGNRTQHLNTRTVAAIVEAIDSAVTLMRRDAEATAALLSAVTGYSQPVAADTLAHMLDDWSADALHALLRSELQDARVLDQPVRDTAIANKYVAAYGFPLGCHVFSGNVPGVAVTSIIRSLLVKSATLGKTASGEPVLPVLFAQALSQVAPGLASCLALTYWPGGTADLDATAVANADVIVVYGGGAAVSAIAARVSPARRLVVHGPRLSFAIAGPTAGAREAADLARAVAAYDQQGCVSPHLVYVLGDATQARSFAQAVAAELEKLRETSPVGDLRTEEVIAIRNARAEAEFAPGMELFGEEGSGYSVILEQQPEFRLSCLNRLLYVKPVPSFDVIAAALPAREHLQSVGIAGFDEKAKAGLIRQLGLAGVSRITSFARLPWPPMHWHHDGATPLQELIYWQDIEG